ncbi:hypothetical protein RA224_09580 [Achromobacter aegrifaciens]|uniref:hypothetical protein n=1 Tax=Achromobacter aegrifaciens TaxID=1287736 RepID=UPI0027BA8FD8|nr:hypothetical protein [Achromobacter aegrifaciens]WLW63653.1 hypothetical protein RA224_09580 [Achromobacter aegrifaciens]
MHSLYARFVLWLIRPALELRAERGNQALKALWEKLDAAPDIATSRTAQALSRNVGLATDADQVEGVGRKGHPPGQIGARFASADDTPGKTFEHRYL